LGKKQKAALEMLSPGKKGQAKELEKELTEVFEGLKKFRTKNLYKRGSLYDDKKQFKEKESLERKRDSLRGDLRNLLDSQADVLAKDSDSKADGIIVLCQELRGSTASAAACRDAAASMPATTIMPPTTVLNIGLELDDGGKTFADLVVSGRKTQELRKKTWGHKGPVSIAALGFILGEAYMKECVKVRKCDLDFEKHRVPKTMLDEYCKGSKDIYVYHFEDAKRYETPVAYVHHSGGSVSSVTGLCDVNAVREMRNELMAIKKMKTKARNGQLKKR
jgi:hypothetical protein